MKIVLLTCDKVDNFVMDDHLLENILKDDGHEVTTLSWRAEVDWSTFDQAIIRTTWDYFERPMEFIKKLELISNETHLSNSFETIRWNMHKGYLKTLEHKGIKIVPTIFFKGPEDIDLPTSWVAQKFVIKPAISAGAYKTNVISKEDISNKNYKSLLSEGDWLCQPFLPQISQGEISLIYFNKKFSNALIKIPKTTEFRVQAEFGGNIIPYTPDTALMSFGEKIMRAVPDDLLYARVDLVPFEDNYALMELELIEPSLYFRKNIVAAENFAKAINHGKR
jgi:glutathione synthase/RimK-type ligase-like ATP-grasp enzyme